MDSLSESAAFQTDYRRLEQELRAAVPVDPQADLVVLCRDRALLIALIQHCRKRRLYLNDLIFDFLQHLLVFVLLLLLVRLVAHAQLELIVVAFVPENSQLVITVHFCHDLHSPLRNLVAAFLEVFFQSLARLLIQ